MTKPPSPISGLARQVRDLCKVTLTPPTWGFPPDFVCAERCRSSPERPSSALLIPNEVARKQQRHQLLNSSRRRPASGSKRQTCPQPSPSLKPIASPPHTRAPSHGSSRAACGYLGSRPRVTIRGFQAGRGGAGSAPSPARRGRPSSTSSRSRSWHPRRGAPR